MDMVEHSSEDSFDPCGERWRNNLCRREITDSVEDGQVMLRMSQA